MTVVINASPRPPPSRSHWGSRSKTPLTPGPSLSPEYRERGAMQRTEPMRFEF